VVVHGCLSQWPTLSCRGGEIPPRCSTHLINSVPRFRSPVCSEVQGRESPHPKSFTNLTMLRQKQNNKKRNPRRARGQSGRAQMIPHPPQLNGIELRHSVTLRFRAVANAALTVSFQNLLDTMLVATTAVAGTDMFQTVKVRRVQVWAVPIIGGAASVALEFGGTTAGIVGDQAIHTDTSMGIQPAHISARPSAKSLASDFQLASAAVAFILTCPLGSVIDLELSFRSQFNSVNAAAANALVGATAGSQYLRGFDGLATAGSNFVPEYVFGQI